MKANEIKNVLNLRKQALERKQAENGVILRQISAKRNEIISLSETYVLAKEALAFLETIANERRLELRSGVEGLLTEAVQTVYNTDYGIELTYDTKNNRSYLEVLITHKTDGGLVRRPMRGHGGGMADTVSIPLRLLVILGAKGIDRVCFLDEAYKHLPSERVDAVGQFLRDVSERLGVQIIMATHHKSLKEYADKTFEIGHEEETDEK